MSMYTALNGVKAFLEGTLEARLQEVETAESVSLPRWKYLDTLENVGAQTPSIEIMAEDGVTDYGDEENAPYAQGWDHHRISIEVVMTGNKPRTVQRDILLYDSAIEQLIDTDFTMGGRFNRVWLRSVNYSDLYQRDDDKSLMQIFRRTIEVRELL